MVNFLRKKEQMIYTCNSIVPIESCAELRLVAGGINPTCLKTGIIDTISSGVNKCGNRGEAIRVNFAEAANKYYCLAEDCDLGNTQGYAILELLLFSKAMNTPITLYTTGGTNFQDNQPFTTAVLGSRAC